MNRKKKKKQADNQGDTEEVDHEEEQQAVEEEIETREAEVEEASIMMQDMEQIENDLNSLQDDSDEHPFKANGIDICALAESLIKGFSPLETLTKAELASIVAKIEADEVSSQDLKGIRRLMPCPFTCPKMFCASPNFLCNTKKLFTYCASHKHFVPVQKMICIQ
jgi:hypothetical protein